MLDMAGDGCPLSCSFRPLACNTQQPAIIRFPDRLTYQIGRGCRERSPLPGGEHGEPVTGFPVKRDLSA